MRILLHMGDPFIVDNPCTKRMKTFKEEFERQGHEVLILAPGTEGNGEVSGVIYCKTPPLKKKTTVYRLLSSLGFALESIRVSRKIGEIDVVLTTCPPPLINIAGWYIAKRKRAKLIYDVRDIWPDVALEMGSFSKNSIYARTFEFIKRFMFNHADMICAVSEGKVEKLSKINRSKQVETVPNGFDTRFLENTINKELQKKLSIYPGFKCIYVGNLGLAQGLTQLLEIAKRCIDEQLVASFIIYGSGAEEQQLRGYVKKNNLNNVFFEGRLPNRDMYTVLKEGDMSFVPLVNADLRDSIPTKMYESLGVGCPVLLAAKGDSCKVLNETGYGVAVSPYNSKELWEGFLKLYHKEENILENKDKAMELMINSYSLKKSAVRLIECLEKILEGK